MRFLRALSLTFYVLVLVTGSVTMAMARHHARSVDQVVICTGYGITTLTVDDQGNPTGPIMPCPDCTPALAALTDAETVDVTAPEQLVPLRFETRDGSVVRIGAPTCHRARAPPVLI